MTLIEATEELRRICGVPHLMLFVQCSVYDADDGHGHTVHIDYHCTTGHGNIDFKAQSIDGILGMASAFAAAKTADLPERDVVIG